MAEDESRAVNKHRPDHQQEEHREDEHHLLCALAEVYADKLRQTRAAVTDANQMAAFDVWAWKDSGEQVFPVDDALLVENTGSGWEYDPRYLTRWEEGSTYDFYALYPSAESKDKGYTSASYTSDGTLTVTGFDCTKGVDLMSAASGSITYAEGGNPPGSVQLSFQHELARVKFQTKTQGSKVTITSFKINGVFYVGDFSHQLPAGSVQWTSQKATAAGDGIFSVTDMSIESTTDELITDLLGDLLVLPQQLETGTQQLVISYRYDGETTDRTKTIDLRIGNGTTGWTAGQSYVYTLDLRTASLTLTVTIQPWIPQDAEVDWKPSNP